jgi:hypothetical protein
VHIDGKEYHLECHRTEADWRELDRLAEIAMQGLCAATGNGYSSVISSRAYDLAEAMLAERKRRRET